MKRHAPRGFTLVELLVAIAIILVLMALMGAAVSATRTSGSRLKTQGTIAALDEILQRHFTNCEASRLGATASATRGLALRRQVTADMPDSWDEVRYMKTQSQEFKSPRQRGYVAFLDAESPTDEYGDAECLFMIVMQGALADCLGCSVLDNTSKGDLDSDGAMEFWDAWGKPIRYVLWPGGFERPIGTRYFSTVAPFETPPATASTSEIMRPLVFSLGPDGTSSTAVHRAPPYLGMGNDCGNPTQADIRTYGGLETSAGRDGREDNITNLDGGTR